MPQLGARLRIRARGFGIASPLPLRGAGFFYDARGVERHDEATALKRLRQRIDNAYGTGFLPTRLRDVSRRIRELSPGPWTPDTGEISKDDYPKAAYRFADRWIDLTLKMLALVVDAYDVVARGQVPSYRTTRLHDAYAREPFLKTYLRESNTLTSTIYRHNDEDGLFIFFTDDAVLPRPLFGAVNLVAGLFETVIGVLRAPFDQGRTVWSGIKDTAFSLPELVFINLRKGTLEYGPGITPRTQLQMHPQSSCRSGEDSTDAGPVPGTRLYR